MFNPGSVITHTNDIMRKFKESASQQELHVGTAPGFKGVIKKYGVGGLVLDAQVT